MKTQGKFILFDNVDEFAIWLKNITINRKINVLQVHHTWIPNYSHFKGNNHFDMCESMKRSHIERNLGTIAQQITTFPDGKLVYSLDRPFDKAPAGIVGANSNGVCIENVGDFDKGGNSITAAQKNGMAKLYAILAKKLNLPIDTEHMVYHHWFSADGSKQYDFKTGKVLANHSSKSCPGTAFWGVGNTVLDAQKSFIIDVRTAYKDLFEPKIEHKPETKKDVCKVDELLQWQKDMGLKAIDTLAAKGLLNNPSDWKNKLGEHVPNWLFFEMMERIANEK